MPLLINLIIYDRKQTHFLPIYKQQKKAQKCTQSLISFNSVTKNKPIFIG